MRAKSEVFNATSGFISRSTVWLFSFATLQDDIIQKVIKIIEFWKKFLKDYENTFYNISVKGST